jgi:hypothetical protein
MSQNLLPLKVAAVNVKYLRSPLSDIFTPFSRDLNRNYEIFIRNYEILIRFYEILIRYYEILIRFYEI